MTEFDKLRALLDMPRPAGPDQVDLAEARALTERLAMSSRPAQSHAAATQAMVVRTRRRPRWTWRRLLWRVLLVALILDAVYLLATFRPT
jgi:anti-sigma factor RsiW